MRRAAGQPLRQQHKHYNTKQHERTWGQDRAQRHQCARPGAVSSTGCPQRNGERDRAFHPDLSEVLRQEVCCHGQVPVARGRGVPRNHGAHGGVRHRSIVRPDELTGPSTATDSSVELLTPARRLILPPGRHPITCPRRAVQSWRDAAALPASGPLFVAINRWGQLGGRLSDRAVGLIVQLRAREAGLSMKGISADSLHVGSPDERRLL